MVAYAHYIYLSFGTQHLKAVYNAAGRWRSSATLALGEGAAQ